MWGGGGGGGGFVILVSTVTSSSYISIVIHRDALRHGMYTSYATVTNCRGEKDVYGTTVRTSYATVIRDEQFLQDEMGVSSYATGSCKVKRVYPPVGKRYDVCRNASQSRAANVRITKCHPTPPARNAFNVVTPSPGKKGASDGYRTPGSCSIRKLRATINHQPLFARQNKNYDLSALILISSNCYYTADKMTQVPLFTEVIFHSF